MAEKLVFDAMPYVDQRLPGILAWRMGNRIEDHKGIDIVVYTMWGKICVQVKSSACGMKNFWRKSKHYNHIAVVIAKDAAEARYNLLRVMQKKLDRLKSSGDPKRP